MTKQSINRPDGLELDWDAVEAQINEEHAGRVAEYLGPDADAPHFEVRTVVEMVSLQDENSGRSAVYLDTDGDWVATWNQKLEKWITPLFDEPLPVDFLTVAESQDSREGRLLQKIRPKPDEPPRFPYKYKFSERAVDNIYRLAAALDELAQSQKQICVLRGQPFVRDPEHVTVRRWVDDATLKEVRRTWLMIDFDDMDPAKLPPEFDNVTYYKSYSASAKGPESTRQHRWYWLDRPIFGWEAELWLKGLCDTSVFKTGQPIFVLPPIFTGDAVDPFESGGRSELVRGSADSVAVPTIKKPVEKVKYYTKSLDTSPDIHWARALKKTEGDLLSAGIGERHETLLRKAKYFGCLVREGVVSEGEAVGELVRIGAAMFGGEKGRMRGLERTIKDGVRYGRKG